MAIPVYVPILKGKEGEFAALETLANEIRGQIRPLIEVPAVPYDYANERPTKTLDEHVAAVADRISRCWPAKHFYIDLPWIEGEEVISGGRDPLDVMLEHCRTLRLRAIPVVSRSTAPAGLAGVRQHCEIADDAGCAVRLVIEDFEEEVDLDAEIARMLRVIGQDGVQGMDLLIDLEDLGPDTSRAVLVARSLFSMVPRKGQWRNVILAAASFPSDLSEVDASTVSLLPRREWQLWRTLQRRPALLPAIDLIYSDYAIAHPIPRELDPRTMRMSANIRYTAEDEWLVVKGRNVRQYGFQQYFELCRILVDRQEFSGPDYSWGDRYIADCAEGILGPGNATTWRKVGTNHHITLIVRSLANVQHAA